MHVFCPLSYFKHERGRGKWVDISLLEFLLYLSLVTVSARQQAQTDCEFVRCDNEFKSPKLSVREEGVASQGEQTCRIDMYSIPQEGGSVPLKSLLLKSMVSEETVRCVSA